MVPVGRLFLITFLAYCSSLTFISCDPGSVIKYEIVNKTNDSLEVNYQLPGDSLKMSVKIGPDSYSVLKQINELGYVEGIDKQQDSIYVSNIEVKSGNQILHSNFNDKKYWKLKTGNNLKASYILTIDDSLINRIK